MPIPTDPSGPSSRSGGPVSRARFSIVRDLAAPREVVWHAWTDPLIATNWWHPHGVVTKPGSVNIDLREGGAYRYTMVAPDGREFPTSGTYLEVVEPQRLRFTWGAVGDHCDVPVITVELSEVGHDRTRMTFHLLGVENDSGTPESVHDGWTQAFEELEAMLVHDTL